jgi:hypothetical protein
MTTEKKYLGRSKKLVGKKLILVTKIEICPYKRKLHQNCEYDYNRKQNWQNQLNKMLCTM